MSPQATGISRETGWRFSLMGALEDLLPAHERESRDERDPDRDHESDSGHEVGIDHEEHADAEMREALLLLSVDEEGEPDDPDHERGDERARVEVHTWSIARSRCY